MPPCEPGRRLLIGVDPLEGGGDRVGAPPFGDAKGAPLGALAVPIVVDVEPAPEPEPDVERKRADERTRAIPERLQPRCQRVLVGWKSKAGVLADAVLEWIPAG